MKKGCRKASFFILNCYIRGKAPGDKRSIIAVFCYEEIFIYRLGCGFIDGRV